MDWEIQKAEDFCVGVTDGTHDSPKAVESGRYLITSKHLGEYEIDFSSAKLISEEDYKKVISRSKVAQWDILFSMIGTIGNTYLEKNETVDYACKNIGIFQMGGDKEKAYWLYYYLKSPQACEYIGSQLRGSTQQYVPLGELRAWPIPVPNETIRRKIVEVLKVIDEKINTNNKINRNLSEQAQAYFDELFIQNASAEWKEGTLSDVGSIVAGGTPFKSNQEYYTDNGIAWITPKDLSVDKSVFISHGENDITELGLQKSSATMMPAGTVLFSSRAPIGYIAIAANDICTNQGFKSVVPNGNVGTSYVYYLLKQLLPTIENMASGSTFKEISGSAMKIVPTVIPDDETLKRFSDFCDPIMKQIWKNEQESKRLVELRDSLLPKLMSGDLDVSDLDI